MRKSGVGYLFDLAVDFWVLCFGAAAGCRFLLPAFRDLTDFGALVTVATTAPNVDPMVRATPTSDPLFFALDALFMLSLLNTGFDR